MVKVVVADVTLFKCNHKITIMIGNNVNGNKGKEPIQNVAPGDSVDCDICHTKRFVQEVVNIRRAQIGTKTEDIT
jgi:hypothetical protein